MGKKTSETKVTGPWKPLQDPLKDIIGDAGNLSNQPFYADPNENISSAFQQMIARGQDPNSGIALGAKAYGQTAAGDFLNPETNPYLTKSFNYAADDVMNRINSEFSKSGRYGSQAHQRTLQDGLNELATGIYGGAYDSERNRMMMAQQNPMGGYADLALQLQGGQGLTSLDQQAMDDPHMALQRYLQILQGVGGMPMGQKTTSSSGVLGTVGAGLMGGARAASGMYDSGMFGS